MFVEIVMAYDIGLEKIKVSLRQAAASSAHPRCN